MSLINEALKRAKQQTAAPPKLPAPELEFKTPDNAGNPEAGMSWPTPVGLAMIALLAGVLVWHYGFNTPKPETEVRARTAQPLPPSEPAHGGSMLDAAKAATVAIAGVQQVATSNAQAVASASTASAAPSTNALVAAPEQPTFKLQGIVYSPTRPSVMINGKTLLTGEKVQGFTVTKVGANFAVLSNGEKEVKLTLE